MKTINTDSAHLSLLSQKEILLKLNSICVAAHDAPNPVHLLERSLKVTLELFNAKRGSIFLFDEEKKELSLSCSVGMRLAEDRLMVKRLGEGIVGQVAKLMKPIIVDDISKDQRFKNYVSQKSYNSTSFICSPLIFKDKLIGVINLTDKDSGHYFMEHEIELLDFISSQIALNYKRILLNQHLEHQLGKSSEETRKLKSQVVIQERLASIGKLAGGIAHEFNNPLDGVIRYTNLSIDHLGDDNPVVKEYLLEVRQGLKRMANIVKSLLACARNSNPSSQKVDVNQSIDQCIKERAAFFFQKNIVIDKKCSQNIPVINDLGIDRIISNLLSNAIDAVDHKGRILIETSFASNTIKIVITDNGKGISKSDIERIFEPFYTTKNIEQGCGLGLTIVSEIVKNYKGDISVNSTPKKGTSFTVFIPVDSQT